MSATRSLPSLLPRLAAAAVVVTAASACGLDKQSAPPLSGPSEQALAISLSASPDTLRRDGMSRSTITVAAYDDQGQPAGGRRFHTAGGNLSAEEVVTAADGRATFEFVAPDADVDQDEAVVSVTPSSGDAGSIPGRSVRIRLVGPLFPQPAFTFSPLAPARQQPVTFVASATIGGVPCHSACTYRWEFNDEATLDGGTVEYAFQNDGFYTVALTVHSLEHNTTKKVTQRVRVGL